MSSVRQVAVGALTLGDGKVYVQSMLNTRSDDAAACTAQLDALTSAGCDIVRMAVPDMDSVRALGQIKAARPTVPLVADIHFDYRMALESVAAGADKIRINPGNIGAPERVRAVVDACLARRVPIRVGVNAGSLERELLAKYGGPCAQALADSALNNAQLLQDMGFEDIVLSVKASDVHTTVQANRILRERSDFPLHLGVTEAGTPSTGEIKSAVGIGALLVDGIGETIRVSLTGDPVREVACARRILASLGLLPDCVTLISCPTCGRTRVDLIGLAEQAQARLAGVKKKLTVAVMGCGVNGPGEAAQADIGLAGGTDEFLLFKKGRPVRKVPAACALDALMEEIERMQPAEGDKNGRQ